MEEAYQYAPHVFNVSNRQHAKNIILTPQSGMTPDERWATETPYLYSLIAKHTHIGPGSSVLDYGCGIGRLSKELIERTGVLAAGVDISWSMRTLAADYVRSDKFFVCSPEWIDLLCTNKFGFDLGLAVWTLQHIPDVERDIDRLARVLQKRNGYLFVVNQINRVIPVQTDQGVGWGNDGKDVRKMLRNRCGEIVIEGRLDDRIVGQAVADSTFWGVYGF